MGEFDLTKNIFMLSQFFIKMNLTKLSEMSNSSLFPLNIYLFSISDPDHSQRIKVRPSKIEYHKSGCTTLIMKISLS